jgi:threonine dehydratase
MRDVNDLDAERIRATAGRLQPLVRRTPVIQLDGADIELPGVPLWLKLELLQHAGSFKVRGAFTNLLLRQVPEAGVIAASGGNHGAAVAFAARRLGIPATIVVPSVASPAKLESIRASGAQLVVAGDRYAEALAEAERIGATTGALAVHAYDQLETLLGQATLGLELEEQAPGLDTLLVAVGGGGLIGGVAAWYRGRVRLIAVEPEAAPTLDHALRAGRPVDAPAGGVAADSLAPRQVGQLMFPLARAHVDRVILVSDEAIRHAQRTLWRLLRLVAEPGGAAAFAALLSGGYRPAAGERVGVLVCGGNVAGIEFG